MSGTAVMLVDGERWEVRLERAGVGHDQGPAMTRVLLDAQPGEWVPVGYLIETPVGIAVAADDALAGWQLGATVDEAMELLVGQLRMLGHV